jgi:hypothetical protein
LAAGIENLMKLQVGIVGLAETNSEWNKYYHKDKYSKAYRPMATSSLNYFSSSSEIVE